jgi:peptidoglycan/xylan/chitin deacetylase (PgdA/CDA1 family)
MGPHVALTFDVDGPNNWIGSLGATTPGGVSRGEFEPIGVRRVLTLLESLGCPGTFFVPGATALLYPRSIEGIVSAGHEIGHHGWVHENPATLDAAGEERALGRGLAALERVAGVRPRGYRSPGWDNSPRTVDLLLAHGFEYDSSLMGSDFEAYWCRTGDTYSAEEGFAYGVPVPIVELPVAWYLDDFPYFEPVMMAGLSLHGLTPPADVLAVWQAELDYLVSEIRDGILVLTLHPQVIGRGHRLTMLRTFLETALMNPAVTFTRCSDYASAWRAGRVPGLPDGVTSV